jgi:hypothetical protein
MLPSFESGFGGGVGVGDGLGLGDGDGEGDGVGVGDGDGLGEGVGVGEGHGVGAGTVRSLPSKLLGFVELGAEGVDEVAFELKTIQRPSVLIIGRLLAIRMRTFAPVPEEHVLKRTLCVSVI